MRVRDGAVQCACGTHKRCQYSRVVLLAIASVQPASSSGLHSPRSAAALCGTARTESPYLRWPEEIHRSRRRMEGGLEAVSRRSSDSETTCHQSQIQPRLWWRSTPIPRSPSAVARVGGVKLSRGGHIAGPTAGARRNSLPQAGLGARPEIAARAQIPCSRGACRRKPFRSYSASEARLGHRRKRQPALPACESLSDEWPATARTTDLSRLSKDSRICCGDERGLAIGCGDHTTVEKFWSVEIISRAHGLRELGWWQRCAAVELYHLASESRSDRPFPAYRFRNVCPVNWKKSSPLLWSSGWTDGPAGPWHRCRRDCFGYQSASGSASGCHLDRHSAKALLARRAR